MAESLVMDNRNAQRDAGVMHNLRSLRMGGGGVANDNTRNLQSSSTAGRLNEARQSAKVDSRLNMRTAGAKAYKAGAQAQAGGKQLRGGALKQGGRLLNRMAAVRGAKNAEEKGVATNALHLASGRVLFSAWFALIPSWGLSLIWINIHAFMRLALPQFFCKLGSEFVPKPLKKMVGKAGATIGAFAFLIESMVLVFLDILALSLVGALIALIVVVCSGVWQKVGLLWQVTFN